MCGFLAATVAITWSPPGSAAARRGAGHPRPCAAKLHENCYCGGRQCGATGAGGSGPRARHGARCSCAPARSKPSRDDSSQRRPPAIALMGPPLGKTALALDWAARLVANRQRPIRRGLPRPGHRWASPAPTTGRGAAHSSTCADPGSRTRRRVRQRRARAIAHRRRGCADPSVCPACTSTPLRPVGDARATRRGERRSEADPASAVGRRCTPSFPDLPTRRPRLHATDAPRIRARSRSTGFPAERSATGRECARPPARLRVGLNGAWAAERALLHSLEQRFDAMLAGGS